jgi:predicted MFS family arabinose efflux permease
MFLIRLIVDLSNRIFIPFIPQITSGLGITITAFGWLLALRSLTGLASPLIGVLADRYGRRSILVVALAVRGLSLMGLGFSMGWWSAIPMLLISLTTTAYLPVQKAYVSDQVCYERRGRALAAVDASYSTAGIIGLPIVGWIFEIWGWPLPVYILAALSFVGAFVIRIRLPKTNNRVQSAILQPRMWQLFFQPKLFASVVVSALLLFIFILFMIFWTLWLSEEFGFGPIEIGLMGTLIGIAEFFGLFLAMLFIDRIGKRRGTLIGLIGSSISFALILIFQQPLIAVRIILILTAAVIEFAVTASIPLFAEQNPKARATVFSLVAFGNTIGLGLGPPVTTYLWTNGGLNAIIILGVVSSLFTFFLVWKFLFDSPSRT